MHNNKRQFIIHFIGHDNSGKTSIGQSLSSAIDVPYFRNPTNEQYHTKDDNIPFMHGEGMLEFHLLSETGYPLIRDRNYICEMAYSKFYNRPTDICFLVELHKAYCSNFADFYIVYCHKTKFREEFQDQYVKLDEIDGLKKCYEDSISMLPHQERILWLDTTDENIHQQIKTIKEFIQW